MKPIATTTSPTRCFACRARRCHYRIWTEDGDFDEVACRDHHEPLERLADAALGRRPRWHRISSGGVRRERRKNP